MKWLAPPCLIPPHKTKLIQYLEPAPGEAGLNNILKMAREGLRHQLTTALHRAVTGREIVRHPGLRIKTNGDFTIVNLTVRPVIPRPDKESPPLYLVIPAEAPEADLIPAAGANAVEAVDVDARITALKQDLRAKEEYLQTTNEELETTNEELKSSNEELQSTNEELETSKEEL